MSNLPPADAYLFLEYHDMMTREARQLAAIGGDPSLPNFQDWKAMRQRLV